MGGCVTAGGRGVKLAGIGAGAVDLKTGSFRRRLDGTGSTRYNRNSSVSAILAHRPASVVGGRGWGEI